MSVLPRTARWHFVVGRLADGASIERAAAEAETLAGLAVRSMGNAHRIDPGFDPEGLVVARLSPEQQGYTEARTRALFERLDARLSARPAVAG